MKVNIKIKANLYLLKLINKSFWRNRFGPILLFCFPILFIGIACFLLGYFDILSGALTITQTAIPLTCLPQIVYEFKKSSLFKRISGTPIKWKNFILVMMLYFFIIEIFSILWGIILSLIVFAPQFWNVGTITKSSWVEIHFPNFQMILNSVNWYGFFYGQILSSFVGICTGLFMASICNTTISLQGSGIMIIIISQFIGCMMIPAYLVREIDSLWYTGYILSPFKCTTNIIIESWNGSQGVIQVNNICYNIFVSQTNPFNIWESYSILNTSNLLQEKTLIYDTSEKTISHLLPYVWITLFIIGSAYFFKKNNR